MAADNISPVAEQFMVLLLRHYGKRLPPYLYRFFALPSISMLGHYRFYIDFIAPTLNPYSLCRFFVNTENVIGDFTYLKISIYNHEQFYVRLCKLVKYVHGHFYQYKILQQSEQKEKLLVLH